MSASDVPAGAVEIMVSALAARWVGTSNEEDARDVVAALNAAGWLRDPAERAAGLHRDGLTHRQIADTLGVTPRQARGLAQQGAALEGRDLRLRDVVLRAASDLQPVVALITAGGVLDDTACGLIRRAFDTLLAALDATQESAS